ncbi:MAG: HAD-IB family hydrolase [Acidobacteria bacterium]|nr:HAD-IB family hydrolase [Acidobacteriota bacterium]
MVTAAIFEVDGTLLPRPSLERRFARFLFRQGMLGPREVLLWLGGFAESFSFGKNKKYLAGKSAEAMKALAAKFLLQAPSLVWPLARDRIWEHLGRGHLVVIVSGSLDLLVQPLARMLQADLALGTTLDAREGKLTGTVNGQHPCGRSKASLIRQLQGQWDVDLQRSYGYGNRSSDAAFLKLLGHPVAVNPDPGLKREALQSGWPILYFR